MDENEEIAAIKNGSILKRLIAFLIDSVMQIGCAFVALSFFDWNTITNNQADDLIIIYLIIYFYFIFTVVTQTLFTQTLGMKIMSLKVVTLDTHENITLVQSIIHSCFLFFLVSTIVVDENE